jgi:hypothetical protein
VRLYRISIGVACLSVLGACADAPALPTGDAITVSVLDSDGTELRDLKSHEVAWIQSTLDACTWSRYWVAKPVPEATLSLQGPGADAIRVDFVTGAFIGTNRDGGLVSCHLGSARGYYMAALLAGTWQPPDSKNEKR